ncbi:hypothetical protein BDV26DRAFT_271015 [Aspergillus bertholletiae]|uniref:Uncharacterized protein n=1 Tax=Aspergillus bertholletiae TaxID=1226010 RepID=A0A5N7AVH5_9EURO|nr:hypothetical protein BDV26DRAFT_271015 [Aspergillus bertholletiae]
MGTMVADYYLVCKHKLRLSNPYHADASSIYWFQNDFTGNPMTQCIASGRRRCRVRLSLGWRKGEGEIWISRLALIPP